MREVRTGRVAEFDERRGLGELEAPDGTRRIDTGAAVEFVVGVGPLGGPEATAVRRRS